MKTKYTKFQIILEVLTLLILISMIVFICIQWRNIPNQIPGHFNASGQVDRWGNKIEILIMPFFAILLYFIITVITFFPSTWNVPVGLNDDNKKAVYRCTKSMIILLKLEVMGDFFYITFYIATSQSLPQAFTSVVLIIIFGTIIFSLVRIILLSKTTKR